MICFSGDGSLLMNIQELATAAEENVNVKIILLNNERLGLVRQQQQLFYGERFHASEFRANTDFVAIARGFNVAAVDLGRVEDPIASLSQALAGARTVFDPRSDCGRGKRLPDGAAGRRQSRHDWRRS